MTKRKPVEARVKIIEASAGPEADAEIKPDELARDPASIAYSFLDQLRPPPWVLIAFAERADGSG
jgi:hypothetical protein